MREITYTLGNKKVNADTFYVSNFCRILCAVVGFALIAAATPFSFGEVLLFGIGAFLVLGAKTILVEFEDKK